MRARGHRGVWVGLEARGECDFEAADLLAAVLRHEIGAGRLSVELDLSAVTFLDAAGLRALIEARNDLLTRGGRLTLLDPAPCVSRLLAITELDTVLRIRRRPTHVTAVDAQHRLSGVPVPDRDREVQS